ncbi:MAG: hypothetical protein FJW39_11265 [Acidobacteria bacterium]|nr:hypothetical protein [Acidobacteriota bacterium]
MKIEPHPPLISVKQESRLKCQGCVRSRSPAGAVCNPGSDAGWGPFSNVATGTLIFDVIP